MKSKRIVSKFVACFLSLVMVLSTGMTAIAAEPEAYESSSLPGISESTGENKTDGESASDSEDADETGDDRKDGESSSDDEDADETGENKSDGESPSGSEDADETGDDKPETPDKPYKQQRNPQTGDETNLPLWFTLCGISFIGALGILIFRKRKTK